MAINQSFGGSTYSIPTTGDLNWGNNLTRYLVALGTYAISPAGGLYTLTADLNFGPTFGLLTHYVTSTASNPATAGELRLAKTDTIEWRNNANAADNILAVNGSDQLTYNGTPVATSGGGTVNLGTQYQLGYYATSSTVISGNPNTMAATQVVVTDANGVPTTTGNGSTTPTEIGYVHGVTAAIQTQLNGLAPSNNPTLTGAVTIPNATTSTEAMAFGQNHVFQIVSAITDASSATSSSTYQSSNLTATITPSSASHKILIQVSGVLELNSTGDGAIATIYRNNTTDLALNSNGFMYLFPTGTGSPVVPASAIVVDSPATTSATTYTVYFRSQNGTVLTTWGSGGSLTTMSIVLTEII